MSTEEVVMRTMSDIPSDTVQNFTLEAASSMSIVVRWQPPPLEHQNGKITGYKIRYKKKGNRKGLSVEKIRWFVCYLMIIEQYFFVTSP